MKARTNITIEHDILKRAQDLGLNVSNLSEEAIKAKLGEKAVQANETLKCEFCGTEGYQETAETVKLNEPRALTWLYPDEKWICNRCIKIKMREVPVK